MPKNGLSGIMLCTGDSLDIPEQAKQRLILGNNYVRLKRRVILGGLEYSLTPIWVCRDFPANSIATKRHVNSVIQLITVNGKLE